MEVMVSVKKYIQEKSPLKPGHFQNMYRISKRYPKDGSKANKCFKVDENVSRCK